MEARHPDDDDVLALVGSRAHLWSRLTGYLADEYDHLPEFQVEGKKQDWCFRYRRGGKTLVTLYPDRDLFTVLVVLGREEVTATEGIIDHQSARARAAFADARQFPDGHWLWIRPAFRRDIESIETLLAIKRRPKSNWVTGNGQRSIAYLMTYDASVPM